MASVIRGSDNMDSAGVEEGKAKAWVNFNGTGVVAIRSSFNVSSITDDGIGEYTVNFIDPMPDTDYSACVSVGASTGAASSNSINISNLAISDMHIACRDGNNSAADFTLITCTVHGN